MFFRAFVHRCGRTARVGKKGEALLFLLENETTYVDFIEINQKAPLVVSSLFAWCLIHLIFMQMCNKNIIWTRGSQIFCACNAL